MARPAEGRKCVVIGRNLAASDRRSSDGSVSTALMSVVAGLSPAQCRRCRTSRRPREPTNPHPRSSSAEFAQPAAQRPQSEHRVHQARLAPRPLELRAGVPGRPVLCAVPPGHLTLSVAPPASPIADSSHLPSWLRPSPSHNHLRRVERTPPTISTYFMYPRRFQNPLCHTPHAPPEITRVGLTAPPACTSFGGV